MSNLNNPSSSGILPVSQDYQVRQPRSEPGFMVTDSDWSYLKKKVSNIGSVGGGWHTFGSVALGVAGSAFVGALTASKNISILGYSSNLLCWGVFFLFGICGSMSLYFARTQKKVAGRSIEDAMEEMNRIEKKCRPT
jgi:hypothetical protein